MGGEQRITPGMRLAAQEEKRLRIEQTIASIPPETIEAWKELDKRGKQRVMVHLLYLELPVVRAVTLVGISISMWYHWLERETDAIKLLMKTRFEHNALSELPACFNTLIDLRDRSVNEETRRKATLDLMAVSGMGTGIPNHGAGLSLNVQGDNNRFMIISQKELDEKLETLAGKLGPYAKDLLEEERRGGGSQGPRGISGPPPGAP